jgi:hemolysin III
MNYKEVKKSYKEEKNRLKTNYKKCKKTNKNDYKSRRDTLKEQYISDAAAVAVAKGKKPPVNPPKRAVLEEIGNAVTHGVGALLAIAALVLMLYNSASATERVGAWVYFSGLFVMFSMSCLYHAFAHGSRVKRLFRVFDYSCIYLLIGATFAPILLCYVGGTFGIVFFIVQWAVIATGISLVGVFGPTRLRFIHIPLYLILGWCGVIFIPRMISSVPGLAAYILGGGVIYSIGIIPFAMKSKVAHFIWHFFVLAGAIVQWIGVFVYIYLK